jgi:hypothetical protein
MLMYSMLKSVAVPPHATTLHVDVLSCFPPLGSWNVACGPPPALLDGFIDPPCHTDNPFDLYAIGLQEIGSGKNRELWGSALTAHINLADAGKWKYACLDYTLRL